MRSAIKQLLPFILFFSTSIVLGQTRADSLNMLVNKLGQKLLDEKQGVGLSIGVYDNGKSYFFNFGTTQAGKSVTPTQHTIYEIGSITKTFESYILANAVIEGKVNLDDDIRKYLNDSYPNLEYKGHYIKLIHLANTTSLLPDWLPELPTRTKGLQPDSTLKVKIEFYKKLSKQDFYNALHNVKLDTIPGTRRRHSNAGAQLLAYILEEVYQKPLDKLIKTYITTPQKMKNTFFLATSEQKGLATGYTTTNHKAIYEFSMPYFKYAGGLVSTTNNLVKYIQLLLNKNDPSSVLCLKKTADIDVSTGKVVPMKAEGIAAPEVYSTALNWFKYQPEINKSQIWADGGTNGFNSYLVIYPYLNSGIILLANKSDEGIFRALPGIANQISKSIGMK
ncbi:serine hydrolase domain-containing protein [Chryseosolibacter indicus]|uniref:Beta-lactamase family protein n=1 Tax=Chryseosolibacter indicus TaxID=2782351 RepID=A0ABS5VM53_9BACT|nr:serine hydrolase domain-containing protein [Chryseosolibacter indicus]MBT1702537.1 beta-lactamase family protein [Chryseosolibacter indicus]